MNCPYKQGREEYTKRGDSIEEEGSCGDERGG